MSPTKVASASTVRSMTGFGRATDEVGEASIEVEIRSVNNRHLVVKFRLPPLLTRFEKELEERIRKKAARGSFDVFVRLKLLGGASASTIDPAAASRYLSTIRAFMSDQSLEGDISTEALLSLPGVLVAEEATEVDEKTRKAVYQVYERALADLLSMRETEGERLRAELQKRSGIVSKLVSKIEKRAPQVIKEYHRRLKERVQQLLDGDVLPPNDEGLRREVAFIADRADITEEIERLKAHIQHFEELLGGKGPIGRKLDFLLQEKGREANTVGSKASDEKISRFVVDLKSELEKIREQVQNVE